MVLKWTGSVMFKQTSIPSLGGGGRKAGTKKWRWHGTRVKDYAYWTRGLGFEFHWLYSSWHSATHKVDI